MFSLLHEFGEHDAAPARAAFAFAAKHSGTKVLFPCGTGQTYVIQQPITFPSRTVIEGDGIGCNILYRPAANPGSVNAAFSFVGSQYVTVRDLRLQTDAAYPPQVITEMGGPWGAGGGHIVENVFITGYALRALSYSVASEVDTWRNVHWVYFGGGADYGFYTSGRDDLHVCSGCDSGTNMNLNFFANTLVMQSNGTGTAPYTAIADVIGGATGAHFFDQLYIGLNYNTDSVGFLFVSGDESQTGPNNPIHVQNARIELGGYGFYFKKGNQDSVSNLDVQDITWDSYSMGAYFAYGDPGLALYKFRMVHNTGFANSGPAPISVDSLMQSDINENSGPFTVRNQAVDNSIVLHGKATLNMPNSSSKNSVFVGGTWITK